MFKKKSDAQNELSEIADKPPMPFFGKKILGSAPAKKTPPEKEKPKAADKSDKMDKLKALRKI